MTIPYLMNCAHSPDGWCLDCVKELHDELEAALTDANQKVKEKDEVMLEVFRGVRDETYNVHTQYFVDIIVAAELAVKEGKEKE